MEVYFGGQSSMTISDSEVSSNTASDGGGIFNINSGPGRILTVAATSSVINNIATAGVPLAGGFLNLGSEANATGATITGNTDPQCFNVTGCP